MTDIKFIDFGNSPFTITLRNIATRNFNNIRIKKAFVRKQKRRQVTLPSFYLFLIVS
jgi:hypothetical protein